MPHPSAHPDALDFALLGRDLQPGVELEAKVRLLLIPGTQQWNASTRPDLAALWQTIDREWERWAA